MIPRGAAGWVSGSLWARQAVPRRAPPALPAPLFWQAHGPPADWCVTRKEAVAADVDEEQTSGPARDPAADGLQERLHQRPIQPAVEAEDVVRLFLLTPGGLSCFGASANCNHGIGDIADDDLVATYPIAINDPCSGLSHSIQWIRRWLAFAQPLAA